MKQTIQTDELNVISPYDPLDKVYNDYCSRLIREYERFKRKLKKEKNLLASVSVLFDDIVLLLSYYFIDVCDQYTNSNRIVFKVRKELFHERNKLTKIILKNEIQRQRAKLEEALSDEELKAKDINVESLRSLKRISKLLKTYGEQAVDKTVIEEYQANKITKVKWIALSDVKVCDICSSLNGKIFEIDEVPAKPHFNCRCWIVPYDKQ